MVCEYCHGVSQHDCRCPNYIPPKAKHYCSICGDGIYSGEKYIENNYGEFRHWDCSFGMKELLEWLGSEIRIMEDEND